MGINWHKNEELKDFDKPIIYWTRNNKCGVFNSTKNKSHWDWMCEKYSVVCWRFADSIKPNL